MLYWIPNKKKASFEIEASFALLVVKKKQNQCKYHQNLLFKKEVVSYI